MCNYANFNLRNDIDKYAKLCYNKINNFKGESIICFVKLHHVY